MPHGNFGLHLFSFAPLNLFKHAVPRIVELSDLVLTPPHEPDAEVSGRRNTAYRISEKKNRL